MLKYEVDNCNTCTNYDKLKDKNPERYEQLIAFHEPECQRNHSRSAPSMENEGTVKIFKRSVQQNKLRWRYKKFYLR